MFVAATLKLLSLMRLPALSSWEQKSRGTLGKQNYHWELSRYYLIIVLAREMCVFFWHPVINVDTLFHLSFTCKCIVSEQFGHPVWKFPANLDTHLQNLNHDNISTTCTRVYVIRCRSLRDDSTKKFATWPPLMADNPSTTEALCNPHEIQLVFTL